MCGLTGFVSTANERTSAGTLNVFSNAFILSQLRGKDSAGLAVSFRQKQKKGKGTRRGWVSYKQQTSPFEAYRWCNHLLNKYHYTKELAKTHEYPFITAAIGHARHATKGSITAENAHPFVFGNNRFIGTHNGTITNAPEVFKKLKDKEPIERTIPATEDREKMYLEGKEVTDSEIVLYCIYRWGIEQVYPLIEGAWALVWWDEKEKSIFIIRNSSRPLSYYFCPRNDALIWSSERLMLKEAVVRHCYADWKDTRCKDFDIHYLYRINMTEKRTILTNDTDFEWTSKTYISPATTTVTNYSQFFTQEDEDKLWEQYSTGVKTTYKRKDNVASKNNVVHVRYSTLQKKTIPMDEWLKEQEGIEQIHDEEETNDKTEPDHSFCLCCGETISGANDVDSLMIKNQGTVCGKCATDIDSVEWIVEGYVEAGEDSAWINRYCYLDEQKRKKLH